MKISLPLDGKPREHVRVASDAVFKSKFQLEVLILMATEPRFYHGQVESLVPGIGAAHVTAVLSRYRQAGFITLMADDSARQYYEKSDPESPFWTWIVEWATSLLDDPPNTSASVTSLVRSR